MYIKNSAFITSQTNLKNHFFTEGNRGNRLFLIGDILH